MPDRRSTADDVTRGIDLKGRTVLVTGCSSGLGAETMRALSARGARVVGLARTRASAAAACAVAPDAIPVECDLAEPASVLRAIDAARALGPLDAVIANAGVMALPTLQLSHGYERHFFTNHVGHHLLVTRLVDRLAPRGRVVVLASSMHTNAPSAGIDFDNLTGERGYSPGEAYGQSKLANILFAKELSRRLPGSGQSANAVHPGVIRTNLQRNLTFLDRAVFGVFSPFFKTVGQGAATPCFVAVHPDAATANGAYFADCAPATPSAHARDPALATSLWDETERILARVA